MELSNKTLHPALEMPLQGSCMHICIGWQTAPLPPSSSQITAFSFLPDPALGKDQNMTGETC